MAGVLRSRLLAGSFLGRRSFGRTSSSHRAAEVEGAGRVCEECGNTCMDPRGSDVVRSLVKATASSLLMG